MTEDQLVRERNIFILAFVVLFIVNAFSVILYRNLEGQMPDMLSGMVLAGLLYFTYRLSRFLDQPLWLTALYCIVHIAPLGTFVVFGGLLLNVRQARTQLLVK